MRCDGGDPNEVGQEVPFARTFQSLAVELVDLRKDGVGDLQLIGPVIPKIDINPQELALADRADGFRGEFELLVRPIGVEESGRRGRDRLVGHGILQRVKRSV